MTAETVMPASPDSQAFPDSWTWPNGALPESLEPGEAIIVDMDGVISDAAHRQHYLNEPPKDWRGFFDACDQDPPIESSVKMLSQLRADLQIVILTARPSWVRDKTLVWLSDQDIRWDLLVMRSEEDDYLSAGDYKLKSLRELTDRGFELQLGFEDDPKNVQIFRNFGLPCVYIYSGYYEDLKGRSPLGLGGEAD